MDTEQPEQQTPSEPALHLFILWEKATSQRTRILEALQQRFVVLQVFEVTWTPAYFSPNLTLFYETHLPPGSDKELHCGTGPFTLAVALDLAPRYADRPTLRGTRRVNQNTFDAKALFRAWTDGGHRVHATDTAEETAHDLALIRNPTPEAFHRTYHGSRDGTFSVSSSIIWRNAAGSGSACSKANRFHRRRP